MKDLCFSIIGWNNYYFCKAWKETNEVLDWSVGLGIIFQDLITVWLIQGLRFLQQ
jgi:hypothetical protein